MHSGEGFKSEGFRDGPLLYLHFATRLLLGRVSAGRPPHLLPHVGVDVDLVRQRWAIDNQTKPGPFDCGSEVGGEFCRKDCEVDGLEARLHPPGFDAGKIEEGINEFEQAHAVAVREAHERPIIGGRIRLGFGKCIDFCGAQSCQELTVGPEARKWINPLSFGSFCSPFCSPVFNNILSGVNSCIEQFSASESRES